MTVGPAMTLGRGGGGRADALTATKMIETLGTKKEILVLFQTALPKVVEDRVDRRMRAAFCRLAGRDGTVPSQGIYKIRAGEQHPWRVIVRRFAEAKDAGTSKQDVVRVLRELEAVVVEELLDDEPAMT